MHHCVFGVLYQGCWLWSFDALNIDAWDHYKTLEDLQRQIEDILMNLTGKKDM